MIITLNCNMGLLRNAESFRTCPDDKRLSKQAESRAPPFFKATDVCARTLNDGQQVRLVMSLSSW